MKHLFVQYELALKLKNKSFDSVCLAEYFNKLNDGEDGAGIFLAIGDTEIEEAKNAGSDVFPFAKAPLYSQVIDWLREKHKIQLFPDYTYYDGFYYGYKWVKSNGDYGVIWKDNDGETPDGLHTIEEATVYAIEEILKMIP